MLWWRFDYILSSRSFPIFIIFFSSFGWVFCLLILLRETSWMQFSKFMNLVCRMHSHLPTKTYHFIAPSLYIHVFIQSLPHSLPHSLTHSLTHWLTDSPSFLPSILPSYTHSLTQHSIFSTIYSYLFTFPLKKKKYITPLTTPPFPLHSTSLHPSSPPTPLTYNSDHLYPSRSLSLSDLQFTLTNTITSPPSIALHPPPSQILLSPSSSLPFSSLSFPYLSFPSLPFPSLPFSAITQQN